MVKTFLKYYRPYQGILVLLVLGSLLTAVLELAFPALVKQIIEVALPGNDFDMVLLYSAVLGLCYLSNFGLQYWLSYQGYLLSAKMENDMRRDLYTHVQKLPMQYFDNTQTGQLLSRVTNDLGEVGELAFRAPNDIVVCALSMLGTMFVLVYLNPVLGGVVACLLGFKTWHTLYLNKRMKKSFYANRVKMGEMTAKAEEGLSGIRVVKAFAREHENLDAFMQKADEYVEARSISFKIRSYFMGSIGFFTNITNVVVLALGGYLISIGKMQLSDLVAFLLYIGVFIKPLMRLLGFNELFQRGMAGYQRFYELMQEPVTIEDKKDAITCDDVRGDIVFENVSFAYEAKQPVLKKLDLHIKAGETVAFVGATGAGKTTIANLLLRFYEPASGKIYLDGKNINDYMQSSLRKQIGLVQQDVFLFGDSVKHNIAYGKLDASDEEIKRAAQLAAADEFIARLPKGYDSLIGERGVKLSGGQKQRLAIARVFLKNPPIVVLDEATSALDNQTEKQIQHELERLAEGRTTLVIAHRLSTIRNADRIVVLDNGQVVEIGTHEELLQKNGKYAELYRNQ